MHGFKMYFPVTLKVMREVTFDDGGLLWWQSLIENAVTIGLMALSSIVAIWLDPAFGVIWTLLIGAVAIFTTAPFHLKIFTPRPAGTTERMVGADVPQSLMDRYTAAQKELGDVLAEINALPVTEDVDGVYRK